MVVVTVVITITVNFFSIWPSFFFFFFAHIYFMNLGCRLKCFSPYFNFFLDYALLAKLINVVSSSFSHSSNFSFFFLPIIMLFFFPLFDK